MMRRKPWQSPRDRLGTIVVTIIVLITVIKTMIVKDAVENPVNDETRSTG